MAYDFSKLKVLIVDDVPAVAALIRSVLQVFGFKHIRIANDGLDAFDSFCSGNHDIIFTDWRMPKCDGITLVEKIRSDVRSPNKYVPVIMVTAYCGITHVERARDAGITEFLIKPFTAQDIYKRVEHLIERPRHFIEADQFFGPDRRRKHNFRFNGDEKRDSAIPDSLKRSVLEKPIDNMDDGSVLNLTHEISQYQAES